MTATDEDSPREAMVALLVQPAPDETVFFAGTPSPSLLTVILPAPPLHPY